MNELQRQHYLSALGVDTYMPRWQLPFAPASFACETATLIEEPILISSEVKVALINLPQDSPVLMPAAEVGDPIQPSNLLNNILDSKRVSVSKSQPVSAADILAQLDTKPINIPAFTLSIWRPLDEVMIIDSRNAKLALPTELLLNNILRSMFKNESIKTQEEILRWPMIENSFTKRTANDARVELQTWISVQHEIRPFKYLWLMGENAAIYFLPEQISFPTVVFQSANLVDSTINALILPSLNEILQKPIIKKRIFSAVQHYNSTNL